jgi:DNA-binding IclR family transcriptional regulator
VLDDEVRVGRVSGPEYSQQVPAADRALTVLEVLAAAPDGCSSAELLDGVGGSRSGLYALLNTLRGRGYLVTDDGRHRLGPSLWALLPARPEVLDDLVEAFRAEVPAGSYPETVVVTWPDGPGTVVVAQTQTDRPVRVVFPTGERRPTDRADALVMQAGEPGDGPRLRQVRRRGAAVVESDEIVEVAVPVCRDGVHPTAALVSAIPIHRARPADVEQMTQELRRSAARLSHRLGAAVYQPYGWVASHEVGPSSDLTREEIDQFLRGLWGAQLACVRDDGTPHVVPLWYEWDGSSMWMAASPGASWRTFIEANPKVSVTLDEPWPPLRRVFLAGTARIVPPGSVPGGLPGLRRRLATRYLGRGADQRPELTDVEGWAAVEVRPDRLHGRQGLGGPGLEAVS